MAICQLTGYSRPEALPVARAAIAAMREPTEGMLKVGRERREGFLMSAPSHIYQGMIDAALSPAE